MLKAMLGFLASLLLTTIVSAKELTVILPAEDAHAVNARILMRYMQKHDDAVTSVSFRVMPGASSIVATNYLYNVAPRDGWTIGVTFKKTALLGAIGGNNINFDPSKFTWLGSAADGRKDAVLLVSNRPFDPNKPLIIGFDSPVSTEPMQFINHVLGGNTKVVTGYKNTSDIRAAWIRGEIDAFVNSMIGIKTQAPHILEPNASHVILQFGNGSQRHPEFKTVPTLAERINDPKLGELLKISELQYVLIRPFLAPPNIPPSRASALRAAFTKAVTDPEYVAEAKRVNIDASLIDWKETQALIKEMMSAPRELLDQLK
jgi:tripartite-type tricarboxylate transporter receptor subunit TctC